MTEFREVSSTSGMTNVAKNEEDEEQVVVVQQQEEEEQWQVPLSMEEEQAVAGAAAAGCCRSQDQSTSPFAMQFPDGTETSFREHVARTATWRLLAHRTEKEARKRLFPKGFTKQLIPLCLSVVALTFTGAGSWHCSYFKGASIGFTGGKYGLWTLEDSRGSCQLWDVLFFAYDLGPALIAARVFSMAAMLLGLGLTATMAQASQFHLASWGLGIVFFVIFLVSLSTSSIYNVWAVFWFFTYMLMVLIVRFTFIHPFHRRISRRGTKIIASFFLLCAACCLLTLVVLKSHFCTCKDLTSERLAGRDPGEQPCDRVCTLGMAGYFMLLATCFHLASAICCLKVGSIQPEQLRENKRRPKHLYAHYPQQSIVTRVMGGLPFIHPIQTANTQDSLRSNTSSLGSTSKKSKSANGEDRWDAQVSTIALEAIGEDESSSQDSKNTNNNTLAGSLVEEKMEDNTSALQQLDEQESVDDGTIPKEHQQPPPYHQEDDNGHDEHNISSDDGENSDPRGLLQKLCCDFRIVPRSKREKIFFWTFRSCLGLGFVIYVLMIYMMIGSRHENTKAAKRPDTTPFFTAPQVCAFNPNNPNDLFQTFNTREEAHAQNWTIAHCGACGRCSNPHDIITYVETRKTIAQSSKKCGPKTFLASYEDLADCLEDHIGFRRECTYCWADNMVNTGKDCLSTCMRTLFSGFMTDNNVPGAGEQGWMNQCLFCDEKMSGPAFVTCSGVARRRLGIVSEIERNPEEQCTRMDIDWVTVKWDDIGFQKDHVRRLHSSAASVPMCGVAAAPVVMLAVSVVMGMMMWTEWL